jgi:hypothetical protein
MARGDVLPPVGHVQQQQEPYFTMNLASPRLAGWVYRLFVWFMDTKAFGLILPKLRRDSGIPQALSDIFVPDPVTLRPAHPFNRACLKDETVLPDDTQKRLQRAAEAVPGERSCHCL